MRLTARDRQDLTVCSDYARQLGYENLIVHGVGAYGSEGPSDMVLARRRDEAWSSWAFARVGVHVRAWSAVTGADVGPFLTMAEAIRAVLIREPGGLGDNH